MTLVLLDNDTTQVVRRVPQGEARREAVLRDLIAEHPALLPVHDLDPSYGRLITVTRELSIPGVGFVDVLLMDEAGRRCCQSNANRSPHDACRSLRAGA